MIKIAIPLLHISDPILAENFYCNQLGFKKTFDYRPFGEKGPCYFGLIRDGVRIHLSSFPEDGKPGNAVVIIVDNVDILYDEFVMKGVNTDLAPTHQSWGNREMYIKDGDNNSIRFTQTTYMKKIFLLLLLPVQLVAQKDHATLLRQFMTGQHDYFRFNGNILIAKEGNIIYQQDLGYADFNSKRPLNDSTAFELASLSKQFTAMGIMILKERKGLGYEDKVKKFFPGFPYPTITIRQLLTHTSGLPEYEQQFDKKWDHRKIAFNKDLLDMLRQEKDSLFFTPGSKWRYSNTGYALLAAVIEKVSGERYNDFMKKNIFQPLGMRHTFIYNTRRSDGKIPANYALGFVYADSLKRYLLPDSIPKLDMVYYLDGIVGDGCVNSTTVDLLKWDQSLYNSKLVSKPTLDEMLSPLVPVSANDSTIFYGFGEMVQPKSPGGKIISHTGGWPGYSTLLVRWVDKKETIIVLSNNQTMNGQIRAGIESILEGEELVMPYDHKEIKIEPGLIDRYLGKYTAFLTLVLIKKDGKLYRHRDGTADIELKPESATKFFYGDGTDRQVDFEVDNTGKVIKAWFINTGQKGELKKIE
jgi:CubicO group peptidase (beta-lactamase class C family)